MPPELLSALKVENKVRSIKLYVDQHADGDVAFSLEVDLFIEVLTAIAEGRTTSNAAVAAAALKSRDIAFARHTS